MNWKQRYKLGIALKDNEQRLHPEHQRALRMMGGLLNAQHLTYGWANKPGKGSITDVKPGEWRPLGRQNPSKNNPDNWEYAIRPHMNQLRLHPNSIKAYNKINKTIKRIRDKGLQHNIGYPKENANRPAYAHQAMEGLLDQIEKQVYGRKNTLKSDSEVGDYKELHYTIENAPTTQVDLHRGIAIAPHQHWEGLDELKEGPENLEHNREVLKKYFAKGSTHTMGVNSWSSDQNVARAFSNRELQGNKNNGGISAIFHLPKGSKALQISGIANTGTSQSQHEYLGAQGGYTVKAHMVDKEGVHHIHLEQTNTNSADIRQEGAEEYSRAKNDRGSNPYLTNQENETKRKQEPMRNHWENVDRDTTITPSSIKDNTKILNDWRKENPGKSLPSSEELREQRFKGIPR